MSYRVNRLRGIALYLVALMTACASAGAQESLEKPRVLGGAKPDVKSPSTQTRSLQSPRQFRDPKSQKSRQVVIYYANETAPTGPERAAYDHVIQVLEKATDPIVQSMALGFKMDPIVFPYSVDIEVHQLEQAIQFSGYRDVSALIVFTNRMAKRGRALVVDPRQIEPTSEIEFNLPNLDSDVAKANPLAGETSLEAALRTTVQRFPADNYEYVLVLKSHASPGFLVTPRLRLHAATVPDEKLLETFVEIARTLKESLAKGQALLTDREPFRDQDGHRLLHIGNRIIHETRGTLFTRTDTLGVIDGRGLPVLTKNGQALSLINGRIVSPDSQGLLLAKDQFAECRPKMPLRKTSTQVSELDMRRVRCIETQPESVTSDPKSIADNAPSDVKATKGDILNGNDQSTLGKRLSGDTLNGNDQSTLAKNMEMDFLSGFDINQSEGKTIPKGVGVGITREAFSEMLSRVTKDTGMYFPLVFLESCHSNLPETEFRRLELSEGVGIIWTSDPAGLHFRTVNYGKLDTVAETYPQVSGGLNALLLEAYREQHPQQ